MAKQPCTIEGCTVPIIARGMCASHYHLWRTHGDPLKPLSVSYMLGKYAEIRVASFLRQRGRDVQTMRVRHPFDLLVDGWRVDIKCANKVTRYKEPLWRFTIKQKGYRDQPEETDFYILRMVNVPNVDRPIHLLLKAPLDVTTIQFSMSSLLATHCRLLTDFQDFLDGKYGAKRVAA